MTDTVSSSWGLFVVASSILISTIFTMYSSSTTNDESGRQRRWSEDEENDFMIQTAYIINFVP